MKSVKGGIRLDKENFSPVLPFDATQTDNFLIYDNVKYVCGVDRYQADSPICLHQKSMVKYYTCSYSQTPVAIGGDA